MSFTTDAYLQICCGAMSSSTGGTYCAIVPIENLPRDDLKFTFVRANSCFGVELKMGDLIITPTTADFENAFEFFQLAGRLLEEKKVRIPFEVREGGLDRIKEGLNDLDAGRISAKKLVYKI